MDSGHSGASSAPAMKEAGEKSGSDIGQQGSIEFSIRLAS